MRDLRIVLSGATGAFLIAAAVLSGGCGGAATPAGDAAWTEEPVPFDDEAPAPGPPEGAPTGLQFVLAHENVRSAPYYPFEGLAGLAFYDDGTLYVCDETAGRIHGWDPNFDEWFQLDVPAGRFFRPVDVQLDGFHVLVLDMDGGELLRYDLSGVFQDRIVDFTFLDPGYDRLPSAFDVDRDGRVVVCDAREDQVMMLADDLVLEQVVGASGSHRAQFREPSGVAFTPDGGFVVADRTNRRLQVFNRLGALMQEGGGEFDPRNPMLTPQGVDVDEAGNVFVADPAGGAVHAYGPGMEHLFTIRSELGLHASPQSPIGVAVGPDGLLAVSDRGREAVLIYRILYR